MNKVYAGKLNALRWQLRTVGITGPIVIMEGSY